MEARRGAKGALIETASQERNPSAGKCDGVWFRWGPFPPTVAAPLAVRERWSGGVIGDATGVR